MTTTEIIGFGVTVFATALGFALLLALLCVGILATYHALLDGAGNMIQDLRIARRVAAVIRREESLP